MKTVLSALALSLLLAAPLASFAKADESVLTEADAATAMANCTSNCYNQVNQTNFTTRPEACDVKSIQAFTNDIFGGKAGSVPGNSNGVLESAPIDI